MQHASTGSKEAQAQGASTAKPRHAQTCSISLSVSCLVTAWKDGKRDGRHVLRCGRHVLRYSSAAAQWPCHSLTRRRLVMSRKATKSPVTRVAPTKCRLSLFLPPTYTWSITSRRDRGHTRYAQTKRSLYNQNHIAAQWQATKDAATKTP
jgi:hypothetical protein